MSFLRTIVSSSLLVAWTTNAWGSSAGFDGSWKSVQEELTKSIGCEWIGTELEAECPLYAMRGNIELRRVSPAGELDTIEINPVIIGHRVGPSVEEYGRKVALSVLKLVVPKWQNGPNWLRSALNSARKPGTRTVTKVGNVSILVLHLQPADIPDTYADVVITTRASLKDWDDVDPR